MCVWSVVTFGHTLLPPTDFCSSELHQFTYSPEFYCECCKVFRESRNTRFVSVKDQDCVLEEENFATTTWLRADIQRNNRPSKNVVIVFPIKSENHITPMLLISNTRVLLRYPLKYFMGDKVSAIWRQFPSKRVPSVSVTHTAVRKRVIARCARSPF